MTKNAAINNSASQILWLFRRKWNEKLRETNRDQISERINCTRNENDNVQVTNCMKIVFTLGALKLLWKCISHCSDVDSVIWLSILCRHCFFSLSLSLEIINSNNFTFKRQHFHVNEMNEEIGDSHWIFCQCDHIFCLFFSHYFNAKQNVLQVSMTTNEILHS